jgi:uncharacterized SAM-binding protein YcdF (DUF218 family)
LPETPRPRDCIIVFGAAVRPDGTPSDVLRRRVEGGYSAWRLLPGSRLLLTGGIGRHGPAEALVMADLLRAKGVPEGDLVLDQESRDTLESVRATARILQGLPDLGRPWVCTSAFHAPRCWALLRLLGWRPGIVHIPLAASWAIRSTVLYWIAREALALPWDAFLVLLRGSRAPQPRPSR